MKTIAIVIGSRANYGTAKSLIKYLNLSKKINLYIIATSSSVLDKYGDVSKIIEKDGIRVNYRLYNYIEGDDLAIMPKSVGLSLIDLTNIFQQIQPNVVVTIGDRFETIATAISASYLNLTVAHIMGGEISGTIDESVRHAVTKLSHLHFPATDLSRDRIIRMGEDPELVFNFGCPRIDEVKYCIENPITAKDLESYLNSNGTGDNINLSRPFILFAFHPVTSEYNLLENQINILIESLNTIGIQIVGLWPNADSGGDIISRRIRIWQNSSKKYALRFFKNFPTEIYFNLMAKTVCQIGNSSSAIREGSFIGTPSVNVGSRQDGRESSANVIYAKFISQDLINSVQLQIKHGKYESSSLFGNGEAGKLIANKLENVETNTQKRLKY
jgi:UDP-hydrolysing UDP-N-acetyl-D-glucosamine 2-epimerase